MGKYLSFVLFWNIFNSVIAMSVSLFLVTEVSQLHSNFLETFYSLNMYSIGRFTGFGKYR